MLRLDRAKKFKYDTSWILGEDIHFLSEYLEGQDYQNLPDSLYYYSEFDSVSKLKIWNGYKQLLRDHYSKRNNKLYCKQILKMLAFLLISPFVSVEYFIKRRGISLTDEELCYFEKEMRPIITSNEQK
jgi:hypothetical protein